MNGDGSFLCCSIVMVGSFVRRRVASLEDSANDETAVDGDGEDDDFKTEKIFE